MSTPKPHRQSDQYTVVNADSLEYLKTLPDNSVDSIVTDPPYEIGFMGRGWDSTGIAYNVELWKECLRVLKPGGHALVFGATRTYHRVAVAIEDAGFEIRDSIHWVYGSGFPKSMDISKAIDKAAGAEREVVGEGPFANRRPNGVGNSIAHGDYGTVPGHDITAPATPEAQQWSGWGTALKPAHEPIVVARKPVEGTVAQNVLTYGVGGLNIDASRVGNEERTYALTMTPGNFETTDGGKNKPSGTATVSGRFPANILLTHNADCVFGYGDKSNTLAESNTSNTGMILALEEVAIAVDVNVSGNPAVYQCSQGCPVAAMDEQSGESKSTGGKTGGSIFDKPLGGTNPGRNEGGLGDVGGASRYFTNIDHDEALSDAPFYYSAKASRRERPVHPETGKGHPTVKPLELMRWLIRLVTPEGGTVLEPFAGSGATVEAALLENCRIIAIDLEKEHMPLIDARIDRFEAGLSPVKKVKPVKAQKAPQKPANGPVTALEAAEVAMAALARKKAPQAQTALPLFEETDNA